MKLSYYLTDDEIKSMNNSEKAKVIMDCYLVLNDLQKGGSISIDNQTLDQVWKAWEQLKE